MKAVLVVIDGTGRHGEQIIDNLEIWNAIGNFIWFSNKDVTVIYPNHKFVSARIIKTSDV